MPDLTFVVFSAVFLHNFYAVSSSEQVEASTIQRAEWKMIARQLKP